MEGWTTTIQQEFNYLCYVISLHRDPQPQYCATGNVDGTNMYIHCTTIVIIVVQSSDKLNHARGGVKIQMCDTIGSGYSWLQSQAGHLTWEAEYSRVTSVDHNLTFTSKRDAGRDGYG